MTEFKSKWFDWRPESSDISRTPRERLSPAEPALSDTGSSKLAIPTGDEPPLHCEYEAAVASGDEEKTTSGKFILVQIRAKNRPFLFLKMGSFL